MGMKWRKVSHIDAIFKQLDGNAEACMPQIGEAAVEGVQEQMLYGYHTPHGPDGHTEIADTGRLFDSIAYDWERQSQNLVECNVGVPSGTIPAAYAEFVHEGTHVLERRPFLTDGVLLSAEKQKEIYETILPEGFRS